MTNRLTAPIVPGQSLGGLYLRMRVDDLADMEHGSTLQREITSATEARYRICEDLIEVAVDMRNGKVFRITGYEGYQGSFAGVRVGMTLAEIQSTDSRWYYDESEGLILCRGVPGISFDLSEWDPVPVTVPDMRTKAISVFLPEIDSAAVQKGNW